MNCYQHNYVAQMNPEGWRCLGSTLLVATFILLEVFRLVNNITSVQRVMYCMCLTVHVCNCMCISLEEIDRICKESEYVEVVLNVYQEYFLRSFLYFVAPGAVAVYEHCNNTNKTEKMSNHVRPLYHKCR